MCPFSQKLKALINIYNDRTHEHHRHTESSNNHWSASNDISGKTKQQNEVQFQHLWQG